MALAVEEMRYFSAGMVNYEDLTIKKLALRMQNFRKVNESDIKFRAAIAGAKLK
jgi:hypothetical protein